MWPDRRTARSPHTSAPRPPSDRKSTRLNSSHANISYAVFCLKKKKQTSELQSRQYLVCRVLLQTQILAVWIIATLVGGVFGIAGGGSSSEPCYVGSRCAWVV